MTTQITDSISVRKAQAPLRKQYKEDPQSAQIVDSAQTCFPDASDPFHSIVEPMPGCGATLDVGVHRALGGLHDAPTPGDILCASLASCLDSTIRMVSNLLGVELEKLEVKVTGDIDVRGTMMVDKTTPVGFQAMHCIVKLQAAPDSNPRMLTQLQSVAEHCCVVLQTLRSPPEIDTHFEMTAAEFRRAEAG